MRTLSIAAMVCCLFAWSAAGEILPLGRKCPASHIDSQTKSGMPSIELIRYFDFDFLIQGFSLRAVNPALLRCRSSWHPTQQRLPRSWLPSPFPDPRCSLSQISRMHRLRVAMVLHASSSQPKRTLVLPLCGRHLPCAPHSTCHSEQLG